MRAWLVLALVVFGCGDDDASVADASRLDASDERSDASALDATNDGAPDTLPSERCPSTEGLTAFERTLVELPPNTWYEAPSTTMREVCCARDLRPTRHRRMPCGRQRVERRRLRLAPPALGRPGAVGTTTIGATRLYAFDLREGRWSRLTDPTSVPDASVLNQDPMPDGSPISRHTYDGVEYLTHLDALFGHGGSRARDGSGTDQNVALRLRERHVATRTPARSNYSQAVAYDSNGRRVFVRRSESFAIYDVDADTWTEVPGFGTPPLWPRYAVGGDKTGAFDPTRNLFWSVGSGDVMVWDAEAEVMVTDAWVTTGGGAYSNADRVGAREDQRFESGGGDVYDARAPGFDYDVRADALVGWPNEGAPRILDLATRTWTLGSAEGAPTSTTSGGTYGRFRYVEAYDVFVVVTSVDDNVRFYKHGAACSR
ncbi:MAG: hypothetical protein R3B99_04035 [Polyangiales bacterium]